MSQLTIDKPSGARLGGIYFFLVLLLLMQQWIYQASPFVQYIFPDTIATYIPLAQRLLDSPLAFFRDPANLVVAPGSVIYMALLGADIQNIVSANLLFSALLLVLLFDTARRVSGYPAAIATATFVALSPLLPEVLIPALSEPSHLLLLSVWLWCCAIICTQPGRRWPIFVGGLALLFSIMVRPTYFYWLFAAIVACLLLIWKGRDEIRQSAVKLLLLHSITSMGVIGYVVHNKVVFDFPMIATGSGAALYFGSNAALSGYEPPYFNMIHDHWIITNDEHHLSIAGDRSLKQAAKHIYADMPLPIMLDMFAHKFGASLFFSQYQLDRKVFNERALRIVLIILSVIGLWYYRRRLFVWVLGCVLMYQLSILLVIMYSSRYSIGALEVPLILSAGLGVAALCPAPHRLGKGIGFIVFVAIGVAVGYLHQRYSQPLMPDLEKGHSQTVAQASQETVEVRGFQGDPFAPEGASTAVQPTIVWRDIHFLRLGGMPVISFDTKELSVDCRSISFEYKTTNSLRGYKFKLNHMSGAQGMHIGTLTMEGLDPDKEAGTLSMEFDCPTGSRLALKNLRIDYLTTAHYYARKASLMQGP